MQRFARRKDGLNATVCKDIPPKSQRAKPIRLPEGAVQRKLSIPPEYEAALRKMYPDLSIPMAIRKFIVTHIKIEKEDKDATLF